MNTTGILKHIADNRILDARYMNRDETGILGLNKAGLILFLDNGIRLYSISENNQASSIIVSSYNGLTKVNPISL